jgi:hypothetical protein
MRRDYETSLRAFYKSVWRARMASKYDYGIGDKEGSGSNWGIGADSKVC